MGSSCSNCRRNTKSLLISKPKKNTEEALVISKNDCDLNLEIQTRKDMKKYWDEHSQKKATNSLMLLMKEDEKFAQLEKEEILSYLPNFSGLSVVELGAGVGRFTGDLALKASQVLAVDFVDKFLLENKKRFGFKYPHIDYLCRDVTKLELDNLSYDFVFSNWLMMYLNDKEIEILCDKLCDWCNYNGYIFFRESCQGGASGDLPRTNNPTFYRNYKKYMEIFDSKPNLQRISVNQIQIYLQTKNKTNQYCFLYKKIKN